jgi:hypothetical protein
MLSDISPDWIFKYTDKNIKGEWTFNVMILNVLYEIDGKSTLFEISQKLKLNDDAIKKIIYYLYKIRLIELVKNKNSSNGDTLGSNFFDFIEDEFTNVVGPVATLMIDEILDDMGFDRASFPKKRVSELIQNLILECDDSLEKKHFIKIMMGKIMAEDLWHSV